MTQQRRLGKGLEALLGSGNTATLEPTSGMKVPLDRISVNPQQPRKDFDADDLNSLKESLVNHGLLQPIVVKSIPDGQFQIIAGERRYRAAKEVGWTEIPVHVVDLNDAQVFAAALVENLQRADLNPIEKAQGFRDYMDRYAVSHEELSKVVGLDRTTVTNLVRLLELAPGVQDALRMSQITAGHARALLSVDEHARQMILCQEIIARGLSVRQVETMVKELSNEKESPAKSESTTQNFRTAHVEQIEEDLRKHFATKVAIKLRSADKGNIILSFDSNDDFDRLLKALKSAA